MIMNILKKFNLFDILKIIFVLILYIVLAQIIWNYKEYVLLNLMKVEQNSMLYYVYIYGTEAILTLVIIGIIIALKSPRKNNNNIEKIDLKNYKGEYPTEKRRFKDKTKDNRIVIEMKTNNIPLTRFQAKLDDLETVYNIRIDKITYKPRTTKYIHIYGVPMKYLKPKNFELMVEDNFLTNIKNELIMGRTRSR